MQSLFISIVWQVLLTIVVVSCFSLIVLLIGLYVQIRKEEKYKVHRTIVDNSSLSTRKTPDVMGVSQPAKRQALPIEATERQIENHEEKPVTFAREIPSAELNQVFGTEETDENYTREDPDPDEDQVDWQDEETELQAHRSAPNDDTHFATGVSFDELQQTIRLIQKDELLPEEQQSVTDTAAKLAHTDLWEKVMNALPDANEKIAKMLDTPSQKVQITEDWQSFDIRNFI